MKIEIKRVTVRDVAKNYRDNNEEGVVGYDGKLNVRPKYQREFTNFSISRVIPGYSGTLAA